MAERIGNAAPGDRMVAVNQQSLTDALAPKPAASAPATKPTAPADPQEFGHFSQDKPNQKFDASKLVGQNITAQNYQSSGLAKSATTYVDDMMANKDGKKMAADLMKRVGDIDGDGKVDKKDLAAAIVAASLDGKGKFDNGVSGQDFEKLFDDKQLASIREAAKGFAGMALAGAGGPATNGKAAGTTVVQR